MYIICVLRGSVVAPCIHYATGAKFRPRARRSEVLSSMLANPRARVAVLEVAHSVSGVSNTRPGLHMTVSSSCTFLLLFS